MNRRSGAANPERFVARMNALRGAEDEHRIFARMIPDFFEDRLDEEELARFLRHYDDCKECQDEVSIQFLIQECLNRLESGQAFNLQQELDTYLQQERTRLMQRRRMARLIFRLEFLTVLLFAAAVVFYILEIFPIL